MLLIAKSALAGVVKQICSYSLLIVLMSFAIISPLIIILSSSQINHISGHANRMVNVATTSIEAATTEDNIGSTNNLQHKTDPDVQVSDEEREREEREREVSN